MTVIIIKVLVIIMIVIIVIIMIGSTGRKSWATGAWLTGRPAGWPAGRPASLVTSSPDNIIVIIMATGSGDTGYYNRYNILVIIVTYRKDFIPAGESRRQAIPDALVKDLTSIDGQRFDLY